MEYAMNSLDIDLLDGEVVHRNDLDAEPTALDCRQWEPAQPSDGATVALEMVSEAAAAIRCLEQQSAEAVGRARELASSIVKQLESTEARAERAEVAHQQSEVEVQELSAALARTQADLDIARRQLAEKDERLAAVEERVRLTEAEATEAQQRAMEANAAIEKIVGAIRSQLPGREDLSARV
jgi:chromosome segregation ATPase